MAKKKSSTKYKPKPVNVVSKSPVAKPSPFVDAPVFELLHNFQKAPDQWAARYIIIITAIIIRSAVGLGSFSGFQENPINGDFEAQRHWMEITTHLPINQWYFFDLQYWGLDYPPLTAYHSYLFGKLGTMLNSKWFELGTSRGLETVDLKNYMRFTSLISELVILSPALLGFITFIGKKLNLRRIDQILITCIVMCQPALILIDHGHFQYNSVMLGFFLYSLVDLLKGNFTLSSIWFISAIFFKQMALYYAPFIFFFILSKFVVNLITKFNFAKLFSVGLTVLVTVLTLLSPLMLGGWNDMVTNLKQILVRVFPFNRGLFEDKVANFWCTTNLVVKYKQLFSNDQLTKISLVFTLMSIAPPCLMVSYKNLMGSKFSKSSTSTSKYMSLVYGFAATAWGFFLFSFQVHEKTVLVPLIPSTLLYCLNTSYYISITQWINNVATFSMFPLLKKDGLSLQYAVLLVMINWLIGGFNWRGNLLFQKSSWFWNSVFALSYLSIAAYHIIDFQFDPPASYPDLWVILNTTISFGCFSLYYLWLNYEIYKL
ncbi:ALG6, ALG8 glycosyltransferase [Yamadazyma tenuis ATCC 10573]|uniref:Alpha-1,3-glucosyltransferase n=1 Tax=Candida tenuis (strain ATCC 10573 / BCRC 21748 / CBS 615 / JCM 9827 / NBRC 10315 / NRRL Y-1498 / VKM Y-70) TaxID=590646 RepID=G3BBW3_CANTC|nr:ALG6, ALG8 glycosyltransferase [Yamadazyma tenuis ATCC 10573]EGV60095.1 ALG6, ALG8 glycosyltransferase [Yamadazyma tenuis ATCC 10573]